jgi:hypothetical protein
MGSSLRDSQAGQLQAACSTASLWHIERSRQAHGKVLAQHSHGSGISASARHAGPRSADRQVGSGQKQTGAQQRTAGLRQLTRWRRAHGRVLAQLGQGHGIRKACIQARRRVRKTTLTPPGSGAWPPTAHQESVSAIAEKICRVAPWECSPMSYLQYGPAEGV